MRVMVFIFSVPPIFNTRLWESWVGAAAKQTMQGGRRGRKERSEAEAGEMHHLIVIRYPKT